MSRRAHHWDARLTHCEFCNAPWSERENAKGHCRGGVKRGKALAVQKQKEKRRRKPKLHSYHRSRYGMGDTVFTREGERARVVGHVRRKRAVEGGYQWRQAPVIETDKKRRFVVDDDDLRDAEGMP